MLMPQTSNANNASYHIYLNFVLDRHTIPHSPVSSLECAGIMLSWNLTSTFAPATRHRTISSQSNFKTLFITTRDYTARFGLGNSQYLGEILTDQ